MRLHGAYRLSLSRTGFTHYVSSPNNIGVATFTACLNSSPFTRSPAHTAPSDLGVSLDQIPLIPGNLGDPTSPKNPRDPGVVSLNQLNFNILLPYINIIISDATPFDLRSCQQPTANSQQTARHTKLS